MSDDPRPRLCIVTTVSLSIKLFIIDQLKPLQEAGFDITVICADDPELEDMLPQGVNYIPVAFSRTISPLNDLKVLKSLSKVLKQQKFDIIQYSTPKAALLGSIAAWLAKIPHRIYLLWGLYYMGQRGFKKGLYKSIEKVICRLSTRVIPISVEMIDFAVSEKLTKREKCEVILNGSACGVDLSVFDPDRWQAEGQKVRDDFHIPEKAIVIGTVARLTGDKGINELVMAFDEISKDFPRIYLMLVGEQEEKDRLLPQTEYIIRSNVRIRLAGWQDNPQPYFAAMDIFCLPTYREGFGEVNLEAQAMKLPVISTDTIGPRESVVDGETGFLVQPQDARVLIEPLKQLIQSSELRSKMGENGYKRVHDNFDRRKMINAVIDHRLKLLNGSM